MHHIVQYKDESQLPSVISLIENDLSEPYSIYTYRYFIHNWPELCFLAFEGSHGEYDEQRRCIGVIVSKLDQHRGDRMRGYIAMLAVAKDFRKMGIGRELVETACLRMKELNADEVILETEVTNATALGLYENLGFVRDKRLARYYLNGVDAYRLKLWFT
ncbi:putative acyltransfersase [Cladochytrium replicatum]|nr:putative acyltransfersase [Cladochytrium replicatum]